NLLESADGVSSVRVDGHHDGIGTYEVRTHQFKDLREELSARLTHNGHGLRRLDLRRRRLQDRWNEINNMDVGQLAPTTSPAGKPAPAPVPAASETSQAVKTGAE